MRMEWCLEARRNRASGVDCRARGGCKPVRSRSRAGATTTPTSGTTRSFPPSTSTIPTSRSSSRPLRADGLRRRAQRQASTAAPRATSSPAGRSTARSQLYQKHQLDGLNDLKGHGQFLRRRQGRVVDRRRQDDLLRADGLGHPRLHVQRGRLQEDRRQAAEDDGRVPRHPRQAQEGRNLYADRHGHRRPVGGRDHGLPEHRPRLLEGRDRPRRR